MSSNHSLAICDSAADQEWVAGTDIGEIFSLAGKSIFSTLQDPGQSTSVDQQEDLCHLEMDVQSQKDVVPADGTVNPIWRKKAKKRKGNRK